MHTEAPRRAFCLEVPCRLGKWVLSGGGRAGRTWWWYHVIRVSRVQTQPVSPGVWDQMYETLQTSVPPTSFGSAMVCRLVAWAHGLPLLRNAGCVCSCAGPFPDSHRLGALPVLTELKPFPSHAWSKKKKTRNELQYNRHLFCITHLACPEHIHSPCYNMLAWSTETVEKVVWEYSKGL